MAIRLLHVSDLHFGARGAAREPDVERAVAALAERIRPSLVVASGDLAHRGGAEEHAAAARFLRGLGFPLLVVPGNHDIPAWPPARFARPWRAFEREWETTEPVYAAEGLHAVGLDSVRPWRHQSGGLGRVRLARAEQLLREAAPGALRVAVLHHQLIGAPWRTRKRPLARRTHVLAALVDAGAELIASGHVHQAAVAERHEFEVAAGDLRGAVVATAPGLGRPRPRRRGEARGVLVYEADERRIRVETHVWREHDWALTARREFPRGREPLAVEPG